MNTNLTSKELITIDPKTYVAAVYESFQKDIDEAVKRFGNVDCDATTKAGMEIAKTARSTFKNIRIVCEKTRKERKDPILEIGKLIDSRAKEIKELVEPHESRFDAGIKAEEERIESEKAAKIKAEAELNALIESKIYDIKNSPINHLSSDSESIKAAINVWSATIATKESYGDRYVEAEIALKTTVDQLQQMLSGKLAQEQIAAQQEAQRLEDERAGRLAEEVESLNRKAEADRLKIERAEIDRQKEDLARQQATIDAHNKTVAEAAAKERANVEAEAKARRIQDDLAAARAAKEANEENRTRDEYAQSALENIAKTYSGSAPHIQVSKEEYLGVGDYLTDTEIIRVISDEFDVSTEEACSLIIRVAEGLRVAA